MRQWGEFKEVQPPNLRRYVRAYWRFLLGWGARPPSRTDVPEPIGTQLRTLAKDEVIAYRQLAFTQGGATIIDPGPPDDTPPTPAKAA